MPRSRRVSNYEYDWEKKDHDRSLMVCMYGADMIYPLNPLQALSEVSRRVESVCVIYFACIYVLLWILIRNTC